MVAHAYPFKHRPVNTTEDIWCPYCVTRKRLYICDIHHWGSAPYYDGRLKRNAPASPAQARIVK